VSLVQVAAAVVQDQAAALLHLQVAQLMAAAQETLAGQVFLQVVVTLTTEAAAVADQAARVATLHQVHPAQAALVQPIQ
jgi:hypothetical protein